MASREELLWHVPGAARLAPMSRRWQQGCHTAHGGSPFLLALKVVCVGEAYVILLRKRSCPNRVSLVLPAPKPSPETAGSILAQGLPFP